MFKFGKLRSGMSRHSHGMGMWLGVVGYLFIKYKDDKAEKLEFTFLVFIFILFLKSARQRASSLLYISQL